MVCSRISSSQKLCLSFEQCKGGGSLKVELPPCEDRTIGDIERGLFDLRKGSHRLVGRGTGGAGGGALPKLSMNPPF